MSTQEHCGLKIYRHEEPKDRQSIASLLLEENPQAQFLTNGFKGALIGLQRHHNLPPVAVYDYTECVNILVDEGMCRTEALEHFQDEILGNLSGEFPPIIIEFEEEELD